MTGVATPAEYQARTNAALAEVGIDAEVLSVRASDGELETYEVEWRMPAPVLQITFVDPQTSPGQMS